MQNRYMFQKPLLLFCLLVGVSWLAGSCTSPPHAASPPLLTRQWMLIQMPGFTREQLIEVKAQLNWQELPIATAQTNCYTATYQTKIRKKEIIRFSKFSTQKSPCDSLSHQIARTMPLITRYKVEGHFLTLYVHDTLAFKAIGADWD